MDTMCQVDRTRISGCAGAVLHTIIKAGRLHRSLSWTAMFVVFAKG